MLFDLMTAVLFDSTRFKLPEAKVRVTYYSSNEVGGKTLSINPQGHPRKGRTVAVDPKVFPYGTLFLFPGNKLVIAEDTGTDVVRRKASRRHGKIPVLDVFAGDDEEEIQRLADSMPEVMTVKVIYPDDPLYAQMLPRVRGQETAVATLRRKNEKVAAKNKNLAGSASDSHT